MENITLGQVAAWAAFLIALVGGGIKIKKWIQYLYSEIEKYTTVGIYQLVFEEGIRLGYHTVVKRTEDGKTFRVTSTDDSYTPKSASRQLRKVPNSPKLRSSKTAHIGRGRSLS